MMKKLLRVRDVVLRVNEEYIRSAAQADAYRTEPAFKLQGSYRNMNRLAEKVSPVMNDAELEELISTLLSQRSADAHHRHRGEPAEVQGTHRGDHTCHLQFEYIFYPVPVILFRYMEIQ